MTTCRNPQFVYTDEELINGLRQIKGRHSPSWGVLEFIEGLLEDGEISTDEQESEARRLIQLYQPLDPRAGL